MNRIIGWLIVLVVVGCSGTQAEPETQPEAESRAEAEPEAAAEMEPEMEPEAPEETEMPMQGEDHFVDDDGVRWRLRAEPQSVTMAERDSVRLTIEATNTADAEIDPQRHLGEWRFQGERHMGLAMWFGNGVRVVAWNALPPGQTVTDARSVGEHLFEAPGTYEIAYARDGRRSTVRVVVTP